MVDPVALNNKYNTGIVSAVRCPPPRPPPPHTAWYTSDGQGKVVRSTLVPHIPPAVEGLPATASASSSCLLVEETAMQCVYGGHLGTYTGEVFKTYTGAERPLSGSQVRGHCRTSPRLPLPVFVIQNLICIW